MAAVTIKAKSSYTLTQMKKIRANPYHKYRRILSFVLPLFHYNELHF